MYAVWDEDPDETEPMEVSQYLAQVGRDMFPVHDRPEGLSEYGKAQHRRKWGRGEPVVTPRLRAVLAPGELEYHAGSLERRLYRYAWSRVDALGTGLVDADGLVQDALIDRWSDPRDLDDADTERFAIRLIRSRSIDAWRKAETRTELPEDFDLEGPDSITTVLSDAWRDRIETEFPEKTAKALVLIFEDQYTQSEAADTIGISISTVERAFRKLKSWRGDI